MDHRGPWTTDDFDALSWHDAHVHGWRFQAYCDEEGAADLVLDIDFILQWHEAGECFEFTIAPATLRFHNVFGLRFSIDYAGPSAGMCPFSIDGIERELLTFPTGHVSYNWRLPIQWPRGELTFQSPGFTQTLAGAPRRSRGQWLTPEERSDANAA
jgi:hypothetical protein